MSFDTKRKRANVVATETLTLPDGASTAVNSSVIDFLQTDRSFTVMVINEDSSAIGSNVDVHLQVSDASDGTFGDLVTDLIADFTDGADAASHDPTADGAAPYFRVQLAPDANTSGQDVTVVILQDDNAAVR